MGNGTCRSPSMNVSLPRGSVTVASSISRHRSTLAGCGSRPAGVCIQLATMLWHVFGHPIETLDQGIRERARTEDHVHLVMREGLHEVRARLQHGEAGIFEPADEVGTVEPAR